MRPQLKSYSFNEIINVSQRVLENSDYDPNILSQMADKIAKGYKFSFRQNGNYLYPSPMNVDRFATIMPTDQVARNIDKKGSMGFEIFSDLPGKYLPSFLLKKDEAPLVTLLLGVMRLENRA
jgi:hypothetical protein